MATGGSRVLRKQIAEATLKILENGSYILDGRTYQLPSATLRTQFYDSAKLSPWNSAPPEVTFPKTEISILEISTIQTAQLLSSKPQLDDATPAAAGGAARSSNVGVLNFASAKNPGGGFLGGAQSQEESLARSSTLYQSLTSAPAKEYYSSHRKDPDGGYYSHAMIFSPHVTVFRDDGGALIEPFQISVVTSPAVNAGVVWSHAKHQAETEKKETEKKIEEVMKERMARVLFLFESRGVSRLVLGSFGTGVFRNSVAMVARLWAELLGKPESRFASSFETVIFGIIGNRTFEEFKEVFDEAFVFFFPYVNRSFLRMVQHDTPFPLSNGEVRGNSIVREIYFRKPKWWARWTWPLLVGITVWSSLGAQMAFYHWTQRVDVPRDAQDSKDGAVAESGAKPESKWELRPPYQRVMLSGSILAFGTGLGILFLTNRSRIVRRLSVIHSAPFQSNTQPLKRSSSDVTQSDSPYILVETVANSGGKGRIYSKSDCKLSPGRDVYEMVLRVPGPRTFWLGLEGAMIEGSPVPYDVGVVRQRLQASWNGNKSHDKMGWIRGPVVGDSP